MEEPDIITVPLKGLDDDDDGEKPSSLRLRRKKSKPLSFVDENDGAATVNPIFYHQCFLNQLLKNYPGMKHVFGKNSIGHHDGTEKKNGGRATDDYFLAYLAVCAASAFIQSKNNDSVSRQRLPSPRKSVMDWRGIGSPSITRTQRRFTQQISYNSGSDVPSMRSAASSMRSSKRMSLRERLDRVHNLNLSEDFKVDTTGYDEIAAELAENPRKQMPVSSSTVDSSHDDDDEGVDEEDLKEILSRRASIRKHLSMRHSSTRNFRAARLDSNTGTRLSMSTIPSAGDSSDDDRQSFVSDVDDTLSFVSEVRDAQYYEDEIQELENELDEQELDMMVLEKHIVKTKKKHEHVSSQCSDFNKKLIDFRYQYALLKVELARTKAAEDDLILDKAHSIIRRDRKILKLSRDILALSKKAKSHFRVENRMKKQTDKLERQVTKRDLRLLRLMDKRDSLREELKDLKTQCAVLTLSVRKHKTAPDGDIIFNSLANGGSGGFSSDALSSERSDNSAIVDVLSEEEKVMAQDDTFQLYDGLLHDGRFFEENPVPRRRSVQSFIRKSVRLSLEKKLEGLVSDDEDEVDE